MSARHQRMVEAITAHRRLTDRLLRMVPPGVDGPHERVFMQAMADTYAVMHGDTPARQAERLAALDADTVGYRAGRPLRVVA